MTERFTVSISDEEVLKKLEEKTKAYESRSAAIVFDLKKLYGIYDACKLDFKREFPHSDISFLIEALYDFPISSYDKYDFSRLYLLKHEIKCAVECHNSVYGYPNKNGVENFMKRIDSFSFVHWMTFCDALKEYKSSTLSFKNPWAKIAHFFYGDPILLAETVIEVN